MANTVQVDTVAEAYLELLAARGIEYFFGNGGTAFAPILEAYAKRFSQEQMLPKPIPVPHEITAVAMAHGYNTTKQNASKKIILKFRHFFMVA